MRCFPILGLLFLFRVFALAQVPDPGLVAYYSFNGCDRSDHTGLDTDIRLLGGVGCWCGIDQDGLLFTGGTEYGILDGPLNRYFSSSDLTLGFYLRVWDRDLFRRVIFSNRDPERSDAGFEAAYDPVDHTVTFLLREDSIRYMPTVTVPLDTGKWHHVVLVREGSRLKTYHNGIPMDEVRRCRNVDISTPVPIHVGRPAGTPGPDRLPLKGMIDELRIYDRALTAGEISTWYGRHPVEEAEWDCYSGKGPGVRHE